MPKTSNDQRTNRSDDGLIEVRVRMSDDTSARYLCHAHPASFRSLVEALTAWRTYDGSDSYQGFEVAGQLVVGDAAGERDYAYFEIVLEP